MIGIDYETYLRKKRGKVTLTRKQARKLEAILMDIPKEKLMDAIERGYNVRYESVLRKNLWG